MSAPTPIIAPSDISARLPSTTYAQLFDRNGNENAGEISTFATLCCSEAISEFEMCVGSACADAIDAGLVTEVHIKGQLVRVACYKAIEGTPLATGDEKSPYVAAYKRIRADWEKLVKDQAQRLANGGGASQLVVNVAAPITEEFPETPFFDACNGTDFSGF